MIEINNNEIELKLSSLNVTSLILENINLDNFCINKPLFYLKEILISGNFNSFTINEDCLNLKCIQIYSPNCKNININGLIPNVEFISIVTKEIEEINFTKNDNNLFENLNEIYISCDNLKRIIFNTKLSKIKNISLYIAPEAEVKIDDFYLYSLSQIHLNFPIKVNKNFYDKIKIALKNNLDITNYFSNPVLNIDDILLLC